jgi:hypothetical protein
LAVSTVIPVYKEFLLLTYIKIMSLRVFEISTRHTPSEMRPSSSLYHFSDTPIQTSLYTPIPQVYSVSTPGLYSYPQTPSPVPTIPANNLYYPSPPTQPHFTPSEPIGYFQQPAPQTTRQ